MRAREVHEGSVGGGVPIQSHVSIIQNKSKNIRVAVPYADVAVASSEIADVVPVSDRQIYILGKKIGSTNVMLYDQQKRLIGVLDVDVQLNTSEMGIKVRQGSGGRGIRVGEVNGTPVLTGDAGDGQTADRAMRVAQGLAPEGKNVVNALSVSSPQQVMLQVRFVEASRSAAKNLGVRWAFFNKRGQASVIGNTNQLSSKSTAINPPGAYPTGSGGSVQNVLDVTSAGLATTGSPFATVITQLINTRLGSLDMVLSALEEQQVVRRLAEPNLVASSGETADFLAGGEFPVPISSTPGTGGIAQVTIEYKKFGVRLRFTPTVLANGVISLKLNPEVSDIDPALSVQSGGVAVPGIILRTANTTVELRDGQAFAIAGMLSAKSQRTVDALPWLGSVPILGTLFSSKEFQQDETELVVIVSPHLIRPLPPGKTLKTPLDTSLAANDVDFFLQNRTEIPKSPPTYVTPNGSEQTLVGGLAPGEPAVPADAFRWPWETR
jgi:pilus assembly protein CpaC